MSVSVAFKYLLQKCLIIQIIDSFILFFPFRISSNCCSIWNNIHHWERCCVQLYSWTFDSLGNRVNFMDKSDKYGFNIFDINANFVSEKSKEIWCWSIYLHWGKWWKNQWRFWNNHNKRYIILLLYKGLWSSELFKILRISEFFSDLMIKYFLHLLHGYT